MATAKPLKQVSGAVKEMVATDQIPIANLATGTPDGTKFIRDDGTLVTPTGGGGLTLGQALALSMFKMR